MDVFGAIEAGGTKFVCAVGTAAGDLGRTRKEIRTGTPRETINEVLDYFKTQFQHQPLASIGIASFGPIDLDRTSPTYGYITSTPKVGWENTDLLGPIRQAFRVPVGFDTDVNGAALGELHWGATKDLPEDRQTFVYITVGTGVGGGGMVEGRLIHGLLHPEMGHMRILRKRRDPLRGSACQYHENCWEGLASGHAIELRWGKSGQDLPPDHPAWKLEAHYLALGLANIVCVMSPQRLILGGGVMKQSALLPLIRQETIALLNNYIRKREITNDIERYIVQAMPDAGVLGAIALARRALADENAGT